MINRETFEKSIKREMTRDKFVEIRDHVYGDGINTFNYTYGEVSSWLTWNRNENGQIASVQPPTAEYTHRGHKYDGPIDKWDQDKLPGFASRITTDVVFVGLNMAGDGTPFKDSAGNIWTSFQNARGHRKIVHTFFNTAAEGAYFTDIIKPDKRFLNNIGNPANSTEVMQIVGARRDVLNDHIRLFIKELDFIGAVKPLLIVFGSQAAWILNQGMDNNFRKKRFSDIVEIWHYAFVNKGGDEGYKEDTRRKLAPYIMIP